MRYFRSSRQSESGQSLESLKSNQAVFELSRQWQWTCVSDDRTARHSLNMIYELSFAVLALAKCSMSDLEDRTTSARAVAFLYDMNVGQPKSPVCDECDALLVAVERS